MSSLKLENFGHVLWAAKVLDYGGTLIWCRLCGRHAELRVKSLAQPCPKHMNKHAATRIGRIQKQVHPTSKAGLGVPWKVDIARVCTAIPKIAVQDPELSKNNHVASRPKDLPVVLAPNFDDPEAEDFWMDDEDYSDAHFGEP